MLALCKVFGLSRTSEIGVYQLAALPEFMIKQSLTRLMHVWTTIGVITLHGMAVWASISIESPKRSEIQPQNSQPIQIELLTLNPQESLAPHTNQTQPNVQ